MERTEFGQRPIGKDADGGFFLHGNGLLLTGQRGAPVTPQALHHAQGHQVENDRVGVFHRLRQCQTYASNAAVKEAM